MQGLARQSDLGDGGADRGGGAAGAIDGIAQDGRALGRQMNPDLVCAAGLQGAGDTRRQGRAAGNWLAIRDVLRGRVDPRRILEL